MDKKRIVLISALVLALAALPTLGHVATVDPNPYVLHHIDAQVLVACFGAISAILLRPMIRDRQRRWRNRATKKLDSDRQALGSRERLAQLSPTVERRGSMAPAEPPRKQR